MIWFLDSEEPSLISLDSMPFDEWVRFVFHHPVDPMEEKQWFFSETINKYFVLDKAQLLRRITTALKESQSLFASLSSEQIIQGLDCLEYGLDWPGLLLDENEIPFSEKAECLAAAEILYLNTFRNKAFETTAFMFWDILAYEFHLDPIGPKNASQVAVQEAMLEVLSRILDMDHRICFVSALHGLGHLHHPQGAETIRKALSKRTDLLEGDLEYAENCISGTMDSRPPMPQFPD